MRHLGFRGSVSLSVARTTDVCTTDTTPNGEPLDILRVK